MLPPIYVHAEKLDCRFAHERLLGSHGCLCSEFSGEDEEEQNAEGLID